MLSRLWALLLLATALLPTTGSLWLLCGDGRLHRTCCCAGAGPADVGEPGSVFAAEDTSGARAGPGWQLEAPDCCSFVRSAEAAGPARPGDGANWLARPQEHARWVLAAAPMVPPRTPDAPSPPRAERASLPCGPPLYVTHCALLL